LGVACDNDDTNCGAVLHKHCYEFYKRTSNKCSNPKCHADWTAPGAFREIGESSVPDHFDDTRKRKVSRRYTDAEEEEEDELMEGMDEPDGASSPPTQKAKKGKLVKKSQLTQYVPFAFY
jgi:hypothetical protein